MIFVGINFSGCSRNENFEGMVIIYRNVVMIIFVY